MRLLLVGAESDYAIERPYLNYLSSIEEIKFIELFKAQNLFLAYYEESNFNKAVYRLGLSSILKRINQALIQTVEQNYPDIIFVFKGMEVFPSTWRWMKEKGIKLVNYNPDNPFLFSGRGSGNKNITNSIGLYDLHFTYDSAIKKRIEQEFNLPVVILPFGFDVSPLVVERCSLLAEIKKVCFLGSADVHRADFLNQLAVQNIQIDVYGNNWKGLFKSKNIQVHDAVYGDLFWETLWRYRVQLNLMRPHNPHSHNMRTFEVPGIGGIQLAPNTEDHATYFTSGAEIFLFNDLAECSNQIKKLLELPISMSQEIRRAARKRSLTSGYSYQSRAEQVFQAIEKLMND